MRLQKVAMKSLEENIERIRSKADYKKNFGDASSGAAVVIDVNSGEVLAMASYPSYDRLYSWQDRRTRRHRKR